MGQNGGKAKLDLNVEAAWAQGVTGKNITTAIMDDGKRMKVRNSKREDQLLFCVFPYFLIKYTTYSESG